MNTARSSILTLSRIAILALCSTGTLFLGAQLAQAQVNLDAKGSYLCQTSQIYQVRKGVAKLAKGTKVVNSQKAAIKKLAAALSAASKSKKAAIRVRLNAARALLKQFNDCLAGKLEPPQGPFAIVRPLAVGSAHACAISPSPEGKVFCWGRGDFGQLGNGSKNNSLTPVQVTGVERAIAIAAGEYHTCAVILGGSVRCWGSDYYGQMGSGGSNNTFSSPVTVPNVSSAADIFSGSEHLCVLTSSGGVTCWGGNSNGESGNGSTSSVATPGTPSGLSSGVSVLATGYFHSYAVTSVAGFSGFGWNSDSQLGSSSATKISTPTSIPGFANTVTAAVGGYNFGCAVSGISGAVSCSGRNNLGQLGVTGSTSSTTSFVASTGVPAGATDLAAGRATAYARLGDGSVRSWGVNDKGQLGSGNASSSSASGAITVINLSPAVSHIAANQLQACAVIQGGAVRCWGDNAYGQLGNGATNSGGENTPVTVVGVTAAE